VRANQGRSGFPEAGIIRLLHQADSLILAALDECGPYRDSDEREAAWLACQEAFARGDYLPIELADAIEKGRTEHSKKVAEVALRARRAASRAEKKEKGRARIDQDEVFLLAQADAVAARLSPPEDDSVQLEEGPGTHLAAIREHLAERPYLKHALVCSDGEY
jgi:hypothetical protein